MSATRRARETWLFWLLAVLVLGAGLGLRDPWPADEPRFALVAKTMVESGDWLFPRRGIELYSDKPPLLMWLQAAAYSVLRDWRVAFLLPSLLAALGTLWCVVDLGKRLWTRRVGLLAGWALLFALQFTWQAKKAQIDPLVTFWITLANYGLLRHVLLGPDWRWWTLGWMAAGLGVISKGVGAIALLMLLPAAYASARGWHAGAARAVRIGARDARFWLGPLAFLVAIAAWLVPMLGSALQHADPAYRAYAHDILLRQTAGRYSASWAHAQPPWYFLGVMATMWLPAMLALPWAAPAWRTRLCRRDGRVLLPLAWIALVLLFFSIPSGKRDVYVLPALPMFCLALAPLLPGLLRQAWPRRSLLLFAALLTLGVLVAGVAMAFADPSFERAFAAGRGLADGDALGLLLLAMGATGIGAWLWFGARRPAAVVVAMLAGIWVLFGLVGAPLLNDASSSRGLMRQVGERIGPEAQLGLLGWREQQLLMADRTPTTFGFNRDLASQRRDALAWLRAPAAAPRWLLVEELALPDCVPRAAALHLGNANRRGWWLLPAAAAASCPR